MISRKLIYITSLILLGMIFSGCSRNNPGPTNTAEASARPKPSAAAQASATPFQPSPTPEPLAAQVNGIGISMLDYQAELARFQAASHQKATPEEQQRVLNDLVDQALLAQAAAEQGFTVDDALLQSRIDQLSSDLGGPEQLAQWMADHGYVDQSFRQDLSRSLAAAWMRDQIIQSVPEAAEQVHASQILLYNSDQANDALSQLRAGKDFSTLAADYDPVTDGDLGWFPRGYLPDPKLDQAAFALEPGQFSDITQTATGFHILYVIERDAHRPLDPDARLTLQQQALNNWLKEHRSQSDIQVRVP